MDRARSHKRPFIGRERQVKTGTALWWGLWAVYFGFLTIVVIQWVRAKINKPKAKEKRDGRFS